ncbi:hypothetical protein [Deinococcus sp. Marseille-Q6407]|uniref:hypothetical protein n=1 Tax=Deinococcus sp. Marseille-Q6407 TaxID=2969223 RepID=UPI0021BEB2BE|nr:hypothetical protein [Deinococcus sp. Marseille-Q6407]
MSQIFLRSICTFPVERGHNPLDIELWAQMFEGWYLEYLPEDPPTRDAAEVIELVRQEDRDEVREGALVFARWPQSTHPVLALVNLSADRRLITVRIFGEQLTEVQQQAEAVTARMVNDPSLKVGPGTRVNIALDVNSQRIELTSGRVRRRRGGAVRNFYANNKYPLNVTLSVLVLALSFVALTTPAGPYTPVGKLYDLSGRLLSAVLFNTLLMLSQFIYFARHRNVIEWERA